MGREQGLEVLVSSNRGCDFIDKKGQTLDGLKMFAGNLVDVSF